MKIKPEHVAYMQDKFLAVAHKIKAHRDFLKSDQRVKDVEKRLRWDISYAAIGSKWICDNIYPYANDLHLDTALKHIMRIIEGQPCDT